VVYATCAQLVNYPDRSGTAGLQLVPEVARTLPRLSADRRTYTFTIRPGFRFSPPSTERVTAATFKYSIERSLNPKTHGQGTFYLSDIVGVKAFKAGQTQHIAGIKARGNTLTIRLTAVSGGFLSRLAMNFSCAVPIGTPIDPKGLPAIPSAGPYYVASYRPNRLLVLRRNPNYLGTRPHRLDEIDLVLNLAETQAMGEVKSGLADYAAEQLVTRSESARSTLAMGRRARGAKWASSSTLCTRDLASSTTRSTPTGRCSQMRGSAAP
jgi:ABC-type oligopeptide transport system substrate-binding subunit